MVVGDRPSSDGALAAAIGWPFALVLSGVAFGAGLQIAMGADLRFAAAVAGFSLLKGLQSGDSGFMVLILRLLYRVRMVRLSGLEFLANYLRDLAGDADPGLYMVEPTAEDHAANQKYLHRLGVKYDPAACYIAPLYTETALRDDKLLQDIEARRPAVVLINLGGGIQERVGYFLKRHLSYQPAIICTGAAIAFLSGRQVQIPMWADFLYLGWLFRSFSNPRRFIPRYVYGLRLVPLLLACSLSRDSDSKVASKK